MSDLCKKNNMKKIDFLYESMSKCQYEEFNKMRP